MTGNGSSGPPAWLLFSLTVTGILANSLVTPAIPDITRDLGVDAGRGGWLVAMASAPGILLAPATGFLADRYGRREVLVPCLAVFGVGGLLAAFAPSFSALVACRFLQGIGSAGLINLAIVLIGDSWEGEERTRMIGRNSAVLTVSLSVLPFIGGLLTDAFGWRATFVPYALAFATLVAVVRWLPRRPRAEGTFVEQLRAAAPFLRQPDSVATVATGFVVFVLIFGLVLTALPIYLDEEYGLSAGGRGLVLALPALSSTVAALALARTRGRFDGWVVVAGSCAILALSFTGMALAPNLTVFCLAAMIFGFGDGTLIPSLQDQAASTAPATSRGAVVAVWVGAARAGQTTGPFVFGPLAAGGGAPTTFGIGAALALATGACHAALSRRVPSFVREAERLDATRETS
jgi:MFS transporter, ACDE family, multidrug resistance protein